MAGVRQGRYCTTAIIAGVLSLMIAAPLIATPAGAVASRAAMAAKHHRHRHRKAKALQGGGAAASAAQRNGLMNNAATSSTTIPPLPNYAADAARLRGIVAFKQKLSLKQQLAKKRALAARLKARALAVPIATTPKHKKKASPLPWTELLLVALAPFALMGAYLLGADYLRRREPRRPRVSLTITRARD